MAYKGKHHFYLRKHRDNTDDGLPGVVIFIIGVLAGVMATVFVRAVVDSFKGTPSATCTVPAQIQALPPAPEEQKTSLLNEQNVYPLLKQYLQERLAVRSDLNEQVKHWNIGSFVWALSDKKIYDAFINQEATPLLVIAKAEGFARSVEITSLDHHHKQNSNEEVWTAVVKMRDQVNTGIDESKWTVSVVFAEMTAATLKKIAEGPRGADFAKHNPNGLVVIGFSLTPLIENAQ